MNQKRIADTNNEARFRIEAARFLFIASKGKSAEEARALLSVHVSNEQFEAHQAATTVKRTTLYIVRDCARALQGMLNHRAEARSGFSVAKALWELASGTARPDLSAGFFPAGRPPYGVQTSLKRRSLSATVS